jgi:hypothetical protein
LDTYLDYCSTLKKEAIRLSGTLVKFYRTTRGYIPEVRSLQADGPEDGGCMFLRNVGELLPDYTGLHFILFRLVFGRYPVKISDKLRTILMQVLEIFSVSSSELWDIFFKQITITS